MQPRWPTVFYTMIVGGPAKITSMGFASKGVRCWIENPADWEGAAYGIYEKDSSVALVAEMGFYVYVVYVAQVTRTLRGRFHSGALQLWVRRLLCTKKTYRAGNVYVHSR